MNPHNPATIVSADAWLSDLEVETVRTDAVQSFLKQETIFVWIRTNHGIEGLGYSYTIGTGGRAVLSLLRETLLDALVGMDANRPEEVWRALFSSSRATTVGPITALALAAIDTAVWDARCKAAGLPLWMVAGGAQSSIPLYDTEGGWLHLSEDGLVAQALETRSRGLRGVKIKVGKSHAREDYERVLAVREAVGHGMDIMVDANQSMPTAPMPQGSAETTAVRNEHG